MSNTTDIFWDVDGQSLQTYAFNITSWGGSREAPPAFRGADVVIPNMPGRLATSRVVDDRVITLAMWVQGSNLDGTMPTNGSARREFEHNWHQLRKLLYTPLRRFVLTKRFRDYDTGKIVVAKTLARFAGGLSPSMTGSMRAAFTVDLELADPYFYGEEVTVPILSGVTASKTFLVEGDARTHEITVEINGARVNPVLSLTTPETTMSLSFKYSLGATDKTVLKVKEFEARTTPGTGSAFYSDGVVFHSGSPFWLGLDPGTNKLDVKSDSGAGNIVVKYKPVYF